MQCFKWSGKQTGSGEAVQVTVIDSNVADIALPPSPKRSRSSEATGPTVAEQTAIRSSTVTTNPDKVITNQPRSGPEPATNTIDKSEKTNETMD
ncbi:unnamed protein product [Echinostoma caproni]|uniref:Uncharacterized protein n=1 Tax=Echinostoma caproni TaxID=27848 RepID=A0A183BBB0_9TREM|nr:unnamed protein product [Echinostoma caproni]